VRWFPPRLWVMRPSRVPPRFGGTEIQTETIARGPGGSGPGGRQVARP
jgi:hypothetical protein